MTKQTTNTSSHMHLVYSVFIRVFLFLTSRTLYVLAACLVAWPLLLGLTLAIDAGVVHPSAFMVVTTIFFWPLYFTYGETLMSGTGVSLTEADFLGLATLWLVYLAVAEWILRRLGLIKNKVKLRYYILALMIYFTLTSAVTLIYGANTKADVSAILIMFFVSWLVATVCVSVISLLNSLKNWYLKKDS